MYCNKVKKGKHCITYTLQLNLTKLNLDRSSSVRRTFQSLVVKTHLCSGCFTVCMSAQFLVVKLDTRIVWLTVAWFQMGLPIRSNPSSRHYARLKCYHVVLISTSTTAYFDNNLCNKGDGKCNDPSICWDFTVFRFYKVLIWTQFKSI